MNKKTAAVYWILLCVGGVSLAENPSGAGSVPPAGVAASMAAGAAGSSGGNPSLQKSFEPDFFSPSNGGVAPVSGTSPKGREFDDMPDYTTDQRDAWLKKCAVYKDQDSKLFRQCFQKEREKMRLELREKFDAVERRQGGGKTSYEDLLQPQKSSGGFD